MENNNGNNTNKETVEAEVIENRKVTNFDKIMSNLKDFCIAHPIISMIFGVKLLNAIFNKEKVETETEKKGVIDSVCDTVEKHPVAMFAVAMLLMSYLYKSID